jgi:hypothetical protein
MPFTSLLINYSALKNVSRQNSGKQLHPDKGLSLKNRSLDIPGTAARFSI